MLYAALAQLGLKEVHGPDSEPSLLAMIKRYIPWAKDDSDTAWCAIFVAECARQSGLPVPREYPFRASSWETWGMPVAPLQAEPGDVCVITRGTNQRHVGLVLKIDRTRVWLLGGNQGDEVNVTVYPATRLVTVRRPKPLTARLPNPIPDGAAPTAWRDVLRH